MSQITKLQRLESIEDLKLLMGGDVVQMRYNGELVNAFYWSQTSENITPTVYRFVIRRESQPGKKEISVMYVDERDFDFSRGLLVKDNNKVNVVPVRNSYSLNTALMAAGI
jgi:hypothetical protein